MHFFRVPELKIVFEYSSRISDIRLPEIPDPALNDTLTYLLPSLYQHACNVQNMRAALVNALLM